MSGLFIDLFWNIHDELVALNVDRLSLLGAGQVLSL